jgi:hypothetical protein
VLDDSGTDSVNCEGCGSRWAVAGVVHLCFELGFTPTSTGALVQVWVVQGEWEVGNQSHAIFVLKFGVELAPSQIGRFGGAEVCISVLGYV